MTSPRVALLSGSIRADSVNSKLAAALAPLLAAFGLDAEVIDLADYPMPLYHGDDPTALQPDFNDIAAMVQKFLAAPGAPIKAVAQLQPNCVFPDRPIDFKDIAAAVVAFLGTPTYADSNYGPCPCPPEVLCGDTLCANDLQCVGHGDGFCINGFCTDPCGRCTEP